MDGVSMVKESNIYIPNLSMVKESNIYIPNLLLPRILLLLSLHVYTLSASELRNNDVVYKFIMKQWTL